MAELKAQLKQDLAAAMRAHDELRKSVIRLALGAIMNEEVAGKTARELSNAEELKVLAKEVAKRKDSVAAYRDAGRTELAEKELAEAELLAPYLPTQLTETEVEEIVNQAVAQVADDLGAAPSAKQLGLVMKIANTKVAGRADGKMVIELVRAALA